MSKIIVFISFLMLCFNSFSQDLIVTAKGDSLNCKITSVKKDYVYFTFVHKGELRNTLLPKSQIKHSESNYFQETEIPMAKTSRPANKYAPFRVALNAGYSRITAKTADNIPSEFNSYYNGLKNGYHLGADVTYFFSDVWGAGIKYSLFKTSGEIRDIYLLDPLGNFLGMGGVKDNITVNFIAPSFSTRYMSNNENHAFLFDIAIGYLHYNNKATLINKYLMTSKTLGAAFGFGYDYKLSKKLSVGAQLTYLGGTLTSMTIDDGRGSYKKELEKEEYESMNRLDISAGLRLALKGRYQK